MEILPDHNLAIHTQESPRLLTLVYDRETLARNPKHFATSCRTCQTGGRRTRDGDRVGQLENRVAGWKRAWTRSCKSWIVWKSRNLRRSPTSRSPRVNSVASRK